MRYHSRTEDEHSVVLIGPLPFDEGRLIASRLIFVFADFAGKWRGLASMAVRRESWCRFTHIITASAGETVVDYGGAGGTCVATVTGGSSI